MYTRSVDQQIQYLSNAQSTPVVSLRLVMQHVMQHDQRSMSMLLRISPTQNTLEVIEQRERRPSRNTTRITKEDLLKGLYERH